MKRQRPLSKRQLEAFYKAVADADRTMAYVDHDLQFLKQRRDAFLASLKK